VKKLLIALLVIVLLAAAGGGAVLWSAERSVDAPGPLGDSAEVSFTVPKAASAREVGRLLEAEGLISDARLWRYFLWRRGGLNAKAGRFMLRRGSSMRALATALEGMPIPEDAPVVVVEGWRIRDTDAERASAGLINAGAYAASAAKPSSFKAPFGLPGRSLEGYLFPETYRVPKIGLDPAQLVQRQLDTFVERVYLPHKDELEKSPRTLNDLVTMASLLEREEPKPEQRPLVAGILWKRIDLGIPLGVDATSRYELDEWNDRAKFLKHLRDESDPYNSRLKKGLPPTAIGAITEASFLAALHPTASEFLYYLHDSEKTLHPSRNAKEHEALRKKYGVH
jgi:UPF0755 protein